MSLRLALKNWYLHLTDFRWIIGVMDYDEQFVLDPEAKPRVKWIKTNWRGGWFADPFILSENDDEIIILAEHYEYSTRKAHISKLTVDKSSLKIKNVEPVIMTPNHLSFPAYFRRDGKVYIYPENVHSGKLSLFEYDESTGKSIYVRDLSEQPLADAVIVDGANGAKFIIGTRFPRDNGYDLEVHPWFDGQCPDGVSPIQVVSFKDKSARGAGLPFLIDDKLIRPAQSSNHFYGDSLVFQELNYDENDMFSFHEIKRVTSPNWRYPLSFHTFNVFENRLASVDALGFRYGLLGLVLYRIREFFK